MNTLTIALICLCLVFVLTTVYSLYLNYKLGMIVLDFQDSVEDSLDLIDLKYNRMSKVLETPIFFDSIEVRQVVSDIKDVRQSLLKIAVMLTENSKDDSLGINDG